MATRVLVLDDEPIVGERLKTSLERAGFAVAAFSSGREAMHALENEPFDILVTDLKMQSPDGMDILRAASRLRPRLKSVVITGFATRESAAEARQCGAVEFIAKPFRMKELKELLMNLSGAGGKTHE